MTPRFDYVFSYWIFAWYVLYEIGIVDYNPKYPLLFALLVNVFLLAVMIYYKNSFVYLFLLCFINFIIKVIPIWTLRNTNYYQDDIIAYCLLFVVYLGWISYNKFDLLSFMKTRLKSIKMNRPNVPLILWVSKYYDLV